MRYFFLFIFFPVLLYAPYQACAWSKPTKDTARVISVDRQVVSSNGRITVKTDKLNVSVGDEMILFLDDYPIETILCKVVANNVFRFDMDPGALHDLFFDKQGTDIRLSVGKKGAAAIISDKTIRLSFYRKDRIIISVLAVLLVALILYLLVLKLFKKEGANGLLNNSYGKYSLSRFVVIFWTSIILFTTIYFLISTGHLPKVTNTILSLLGISVASGLGAQVANGITVKKTQTESKDTERKSDQLSPSSKSMLTNGISHDLRIDRLQALAFNLIYGGYFIYEMIFRFYQPEFDTNTLVLLGISNGLYVGIKPSV